METLIIHSLLVVVSGVVGSKNITSSSQEAHNVENLRAIDDYILGLDYINNEVMSYKGDTLTSDVPKHGELDERKTFTVIEKIKHSFETIKPDIGVLASNEHTCYPGSLLVANQRLLDNSPDMIVDKRAPLVYTVNLPGMQSDGSFKIVPSFHAYQAAVNQALEKWFEEYSNDHDVIANFESDCSLALSKELLRVKFGLDFKYSNIELNTDFESMNKQEKLILICKFKQIFYTVSVEPTAKPSDLFDPSVDVENLKRKMDAKNPPVIVDTVEYGRTIYVKIETSSTNENAKMVLGGNVDILNIGSDNELEYSKNLENLAITVYVIGGSSEHIQLVSAKTFQEVNEVIKKYGKFSKKNLGYPVSYSTQFIKDNSRATVNYYTDYYETIRTEYTSGIIELVHKGWYITQWEVTWKEINYDANGNKTVAEKSWWKNGKLLTAPFHGEIQVPGNTEAIHVMCKEATGLIWEPWRTVFNRSGIPLVSRRAFHVWGITLNPKYKIEPKITGPTRSF